MTPENQFDKAESNPQEGQEPKVNTSLLVMFRRWPEADGGNLIALFPARAADASGAWCDAFENGEWAAFNVDDLGLTLPTTTNPEDTQEVSAITEELAAQGYTLLQVAEITEEMHEARRQNARDQIEKFQWPFKLDDQTSDDQTSDDQTEQNAR